VRFGAEDLLENLGCRALGARKHRSLKPSDIPIMFACADSAEKMSRSFCQARGATKFLVVI